ncbi:uncharacterized protein LACBIDRAFT_324586 [Laccaria bicolor S238N-H82]|uniref:Predicted protein n=1 Tax=Laccaria bicolor (strain S238N-H82 / ATCC MYA-4686) TaxID=486041 RepID=B0D2E0_LACBS|nr:uncharacterized protein LACBIDRAFT_324586 [Laccaria bicolor S238N-H82]EDR11084.1 predicted protein [Laccaria bicolor S238N-H82]|eukprot:XP_001878385.1 predicted protein [Laccaria bicolor S238N-H82]
MCRWRQFVFFVSCIHLIHLFSFLSVCNHYLQCGHKETQPEEMVSSSYCKLTSQRLISRIKVFCDSANCKFSPNHLPTCTPPDCIKTCWQFRQFPEQYRSTTHDPGAAEINLLPLKSDWRLSTIPEDHETEVNDAKSLLRCPTEVPDKT